jgi:hypothetical protein
MPHPLVTPAARWKQHYLSVAIAALLVLRLAWPVPMSAAPERGLAAGLIEHALCLSKTTNGDSAPIPFERSPTAPGGHADHDTAGCCQWHAATVGIVPGTALWTRIAFAPCADIFVIAALPPPGRRAAPAQARAPPA